MTRKKPVLRSSKPAFGVLILGIAVQGVVIYQVRLPIDRLALALLALVPIIWTAARLGVVQRIAQVVQGRPYRRQYLRLRRQVDQLLEDIRRLNWTAVDQQRRFRSPGVIEAELDSIEASLVHKIRQIRLAAGEPTTDYVDRPDPEEVEKAIFNGHLSETLPISKLPKTISNRAATPGSGAAPPGTTRTTPSGQRSSNTEPGRHRTP